MKRLCPANVVGKGEQKTIEAFLDLIACVKEETMEAATSRSLKYSAVPRVLACFRTFYQYQNKLAWAVTHYGSA